VPEFIKILRKVDDAAPDDREVFLSAPQKLSQFPLFLDILTLAPLNDLAIERSMQRLRRGLLGVVLQDARDAQGLAFYQALAQQAFINEYIYDAGDSEGNQLSALEGKIATALANTSDVSLVALCVLAMYKPLHIFDWATNRRRNAWGSTRTRSHNPSNRRAAKRPGFARSNHVADRHRR